MALYDSIELPASVRAKIQFSPIEAVINSLLKEKFPDLDSHVKITTKPRLPFVLVRRLDGMGDWAGDPRGFYDTARIALHVYADDPDGDVKGALISEAIRAEFFDAWQNHYTCPFGTVVKLKLTSEPSRRSDWATSSGPVQYADLPTGAWRYEGHYEMVVRPPRP